MWLPFSIRINLGPHKCKTKSTCNTLWYHHSVFPVSYTDLADDGKDYDIRQSEIRDVEVDIKEDVQDVYKRQVVGKDSGIASQADLAGKVVECQVDSSAEAALKEVPDLTATFKELLTTADYNTAFMDLEQGAVDAIAMDVICLLYTSTPGHRIFKGQRH